MAGTSKETLPALSLKPLARVQSVMTREREWASVRISLEKLRSVISVLTEVVSTLLVVANIS